MSIDILKMSVPIPKLMNHQTVLFVGPHPDDIEIGAGGLAAKLALSGKRVYFCIVTDGGSGTLDPDISIERLAEIRSQETMKSASVMKVKEIFQLGFPDGGIFTSDEVASKIARVLLEVNPDLVICPDPFMPSETHPDHIKTGLAVNRAVVIANYPNMAKQNHVIFDKTQLSHFRGRTIGYYYTHRVNEMIHLGEDDLKLKMDAIECHQSQFPKTEDFQLILGYLDLRSKWLLAGELSAGAEGYFVLGSTHQHCFPEINFY
ncbi:MAG: PIG-L family deacetylase [Firmicutes bacterium]|nr:PIG-L family deacetylase [Bacillota bacterium]